MSLLTMGDAVLSKLGLPTSAISSQVRNKITLYLNENQKGIAKKTNWRRLLASSYLDTASGTATYTLVSNVIEEHGLEDVWNTTNNHPIVILSDAKWKARRSMAESGPPREYRFFGRSTNSINIEFKQVPDAVYRVDYEFFGYPSKLVNPTDETPFDEEMMILGALADKLQYDRDPTWSIVRGEYQEMLDSDVGRNNSEGQDMRMGGSSESHDDSPPRLPYPYGH